MNKEELDQARQAAKRMADDFWGEAPEDFLAMIAKHDYEAMMLSAIVAYVELNKTTKYGRK